MAKCQLQGTGCMAQCGQHQSRSIFTVFLQTSFTDDPQPLSTQQQRASERSGIPCAMIGFMEDLTQVRYRIRVSHQCNYSCVL